MDICDPKGKSMRTIAVCDIDSLEPQNGTRFTICYKADPYGSSLPILGKIAQRNLKKMDK